MEDYNTKVTTTTGALGTQADIVIFSLVKNNPERNVGAEQEHYRILIKLVEISKVTLIS